MSSWLNFFLHHVYGLNSIDMVVSIYNTQNALLCANL